MPYRIEITPEAKQEIEHELAYSRKQWGAHHTGQYRQGITDMLRRIAANPLQYALKPYYGDGVRAVLYKGNYIVYQCDTKQLQRFPIPQLALSEKYRGSQFFKLHFLEGVGELEALAAEKQTLQAPWPTDVVMGFPIMAKEGTVKIDTTMTFVEIWKEIPYPTIVGVLDSIRTRLLDLSMQLGEEEPAVEREQRITDPERVEQAANRFYTIVYAQSANVALGNRDVTQTQELPAPYDSDGLIDYLRKLGLNEDMIEDLQNALNEDAEEDKDNGESGERQGPGRRVLTWLKNVSTAAATKVGTPVATTLITQALLHHFGL
jgi:plasmid stabilization system protein ParE